MDFDTSGRAFWQMENGWLDTGNGEDLIAGADGYSLGIVNVTGSNRWVSYLAQTRFYMTQQTGQIALVTRYQDRRNYYRAVIEITPNSRYARLERVVNGDTTVLASQDLDSTEYKAPKIANTTEAQAVVFGFLVNGPTLTVQINGEMVLRKNDNRLAMGSAGIGQRQNRVLFDLLEVASPGESSAISTPETTDKSVYSVQVASMRDLSSANNLIDRLNTSGFTPFLIEDSGNYKVVLGRFSNRNEANKMRLVMVSEGFSLSEVVDLTNRPEIADAPPRTSIKDVSNAVLDEAGWEDLTPDQRRQVADLVQRKMNTQTESQTVAEIMDIKRKIEELSKEQKKFINLFESDKANRLQVIEETRRLSQDFDRALNSNNIARAEQIIEQVRRSNPASTLPKIMTDRIARLRQQQDNEKDRAKVMKEVNLLIVEAEELGKSNKLRDMKLAKGKWEAVRSKAALWDKKMVDQANSQIQRLQNKIDNLVEQENKALEEAFQKTQKQSNLIWFVLAGIVLFIIVLVVVIYLAGRRRYLRMMQQMREEALAPLEDLRQQARLGTQETTGIEYQEAQGMLDQSDDSSAEYMVPNKAQDPQPAPPAPEEEKPAAPQPEPSQPPVSKQTQEEVPPAEDDDGGIDLGSFGTPDKPAPESTPEPEPVPTPQAQTAPTDSVQPEMEADDDDAVTIDFGDDIVIESSDEADDALNISAAEPSEESLDDLVFDFDDTIAHDMSAPVESSTEPSPTETQESFTPEPESTEDDILDISESPTMADLEAPEPMTFEVNDEPEQTPAAQPQTPKSEPQTAQPESTPEPVVKAEQKPASAPPPPSPSSPEPATSNVVAGMFDTPSSGNPQAATPSPAAENVIYSMEMAEGETGAPPEGWNGEVTDYATAQIVDDPAGNGQKCFRFRKTSGSAPTAFAHWFDPVQGQFNIDFKVRCDDKNKHLLGLYLEADADFRRSIHTVIQYAPGNDKAHLRVFTRPTTYKMGEWVHVHYEVDLEEGLVDGYVDGELVAEGIRMGMSTDKINVLSIRDNAETTGTMYMKDFTISKA